MGNDDWIEPPFEGKQFTGLHSERIELGDYSFVGYPYSLPFMGGVYEKPERQIKEDLLALEPLLDSRTVFVTHSPAKGILDGGHGSTSLASLLRRKTVRAHIHGHSHSSFGRKENRFNVAAGYVWRAMIIDLDTLEHHVLQYEN
jgi:Icc-related predicted phosphoesterase